jgi:hypothetical protein
MLGQSNLSHIEIDISEIVFLHHSGTAASGLTEKAG